jgi:hypothetical protein
LRAVFGGGRTFLHGLDPKAKAPGLRKALAAAMERLFTAKKIKVESYGRPSNLHTRLARCE